MLWGLNTISEHHETLKELAGAQSPVQELQSKVSCLCKSNTVATSLRGVDARLQGGLVDARAQDKHDLWALQTKANADWDILQATARDRTRVQTFLDAKREKSLYVELLITNSRRRVSHDSSLVDSTSASLHSHMPHAYATCSQSPLSEIAGRNSDYCAVYPSEVGTQLGAYDYTIKRGVQSMLIILDHREDLCRDNAPANPQTDCVSPLSTPLL